jgi:glycosyltransferase involved in cell wall biosynthesis
MKKLAVLLPAYNAAPYLIESIDSILNQTFTDFELYVYDDCSTDNTEEIVSEYIDTRVFYIKNNVNLGISKTLNKGLQELLPQYEYIARMDADDWAYPDRFQKQINYLDKNQEVILCGTQGYWLKDINQNPTSGWKYPVNYEYIKYYLLFAASFGHSSVIFRSDNFQKQNFRYNETITTCEDWDLWIRVVKTGKMANLPNFLMKYRILENSNHRSPEKIKKHLVECSKIISNYWMNLGQNITEQEIFALYFGGKENSRDLLILKIRKLIAVFNAIYFKANSSLSYNDTRDFSYLLARKILNYWKRSGVSRFHPMLWFLILKEVKFMCKVKLIKSIIK